MGLNEFESANTSPTQERNKKIIQLIDRLYSPEVTTETSKLVALLAERLTKMM